MKSKKRHPKIPSKPENVYKEFIDYYDFLNSFKPFIEPKGDYWTYKKSKAFVQKLNLQNISDWKKYYQSGKKPINIPGTPQKTYGKEFEGYEVFLGTKKNWVK